MQRRDGGEDAPRRSRAHVAEEQREEQGPDVGAVDVGVGHEDHLAVPGGAHVERAARAGPDHLDERGALGVGEHVPHGGLLDVEDLAADRQ